MTPRAHKNPKDVPLSDAMIVWNRGKDIAVVHHPDHGNITANFSSSVGACYADWRDRDERGQLLMLMIEAWHIAAFYEIPAHVVHEALLCIPEYRATLARDCLPGEFQHERD